MDFTGCGSGVERVRRLQNHGGKLGGKGRGYSRHTTRQRTTSATSSISLHGRQLAPIKSRLNRVCHCGPCDMPLTNSFSTSSIPRPLAHAFTQRCPASSECGVGAWRDDFFWFWPVTSDVLQTVFSFDLIKRGPACAADQPRQ